MDGSEDTLFDGYLESEEVKGDIDKEDDEFNNDSRDYESEDNSEDENDTYY